MRAADLWAVCLRYASPRLLLYTALTNEDRGPLDPESGIRAQIGRAHV